MELREAQDVLAEGLWRLTAESKPWKRRQDYYDGEQCLPYAPEGVNEEYLELRKQAIANWLKLVADAPIQRVRAIGFRTGKGKRDKKANARWQANKMDSRQRAILQDMMVHGRGLAGVWVNTQDRERPIMRPECGENVHLEMDPADPFTSLWAVKRVIRRRPGVTPHSPAVTGLIMPDGSPIPSSADVSVAWVHDNKTWFKFEAPGAAAGFGSYRLISEGSNPLGAVPFVPYDLHVNSKGRARSAISQLIPAQDALNTIRFNTLLAMQFSAFRQRVFTGYDPVLRDDNGEIVWVLDSDGNPKLDSNGQKIPVTISPGRFGVDRALVFPGAETKVFDLAESNLDNYIKVLSEFLSELFALGQVPPQYLLNKMANLSGDALTAAESTLQALITDIQTGAGEANEELMRLGGVAAGDDGGDFASETVWADAEARSFAQVVDGITKLATSGLPKRAWFPMVPGASPQQAEQWLQWAEEEANKALEQSPTVAAANAFRQHQEQLGQQQGDAGSGAPADQ